MILNNIRECERVHKQPVKIYKFRVLFEPFIKTRAQTMKNAIERNENGQANKTRRTQVESENRKTQNHTLC